MRLGDLDALKDRLKELLKTEPSSIYGCGLRLAIENIDNAPTVEIPENAVNCVLTMFGKCSYNETGCSDCEIKDKIRKALNERPQGEWIRKPNKYRVNICCTNCGYDDGYSCFKYCPNCGADMQKKIQTPSCLTNPERQAELLERYKEG